MRSVSKEELFIKTIETRIGSGENLDLIEKLLQTYAKFRARLWVDLVEKKLNPNEEKKRSIRDGLSGRAFNSIKYDIQGVEKSLKELKSRNIEEIKGRILSEERILKDKKKIAVQLKNEIALLLNYKERIKIWKAEKHATIPLGGKQPSKKPKIPKLVRHKELNQLKENLAKKQFIIHQKSRSLYNLIGKLSFLESSGISICFGGKTLFKAQHHLKENRYINHDEWYEDFNLARSSSMLFIGSSDEAFGNNNCRYDKDHHTLSIKLPKRVDFQDFGDRLVLQNIKFPPNLREEFYRCLSSDHLKNPKHKTNAPVSYRLIRRLNKLTKERSYYVQASFEVAKNRPESSRDLGAIGVDLNTDHIAISEIDRYGNFIDGFVIPLNFHDKSSNQSGAILSDAVATIVDYAQKRSKPLVIENLDFSAKKRRLKEYPKSYRRMLSSFVYQRFYEMISSRCNKSRVEMITVNPAFSSLIGAYKYQGLDISSHLKAALILARRGLRFGEKNRIYHVTPKGRAGKLYFPNDASGHVWRFYSKIRVHIKRHLMGQQPNLERFLSQDDLIRRRPSLENSLAFDNKIYVNEDGKTFVTLGAGRSRQISLRLLESKPF